VYEDYAQNLPWTDTDEYYDEMVGAAKSAERCPTWKFITRNFAATVVAILN
jgi:hypothetical protein